MMFNLSYTVLGKSIGRGAPHLASYVTRLNPIKLFVCEQLLLQFKKKLLFENSQEGRCSYGHQQHASKRVVRIRILSGSFSSHKACPH
jgi:hypothetical protein